MDPLETILCDPLSAKPLSPFVRWHLRRKYRVIDDLFSRYLASNSRFVDMGCGNGDALVLAQMHENECELWGLDMDAESIDMAKRRIPNATLVLGDMQDPSGLPQGHFDVVHEFGAAFLTQDWAILAKVYFSLLRDGGILLWELPQKWSAAHIAYMLRPAPRKNSAEGKISRILRSFSPSKYRFESDKRILQALTASGCDFEILERIPIWHFFCRGFLCRFVNWTWKFGGDAVFDQIDSTMSRIWPRCAGSYLVVRKGSSCREPENQAALR